jgi:hypothetical protein
MNYENLSDLYSLSIDSNRNVTSRPPYVQHSTQSIQPTQPLPRQHVQTVQPVQPVLVPHYIPEQIGQNNQQMFPVKQDCSYSCNISQQNGPPMQPIVMNGTNPIRNGMYTAVHPTACSQYGSSNINLGPGEFYTGTPWCQVGIVMNERTVHLNNVYVLEAQFIGNSWSFRVKDPLTGIHIYLDTVGNGPNRAYRTNEMLTVPGKEGLWKVQVQIQNQPYILYVP